MIEDGYQGIKESRVKMARFNSGRGGRGRGRSNQGRGRGRSSSRSRSNNTTGSKLMQFAPMSSNSARKFATFDAVKKAWRAKVAKAVTAGVNDIVKRTRTRDRCRV